MFFILFDTEYTSWKGCLENGREDWQKKEIVQIAALKIDECLQVAGELNIYVKPEINPVLSEYFINLTGITNEKLAAEGVPFREAYACFKAFAGDCICYSHAWGAPDGCLADGEVMGENLQYSRLIDNQPPVYCNIAPWFEKKYAEKGINIKSQCSGDIARLLGCDEPILNLGLDTHNAFYDVYSVLYGLRFLGFSAIEKN